MLDFAGAADLLAAFAPAEEEKMSRVELSITYRTMMAVDRAVRMLPNRPETVSCAIVALRVLALEFEREGMVDA